MGGSSVSRVPNLRLLFGPLVLLALGTFDFFGLHSRSYEASLAIVQRLYAPFYPASAQDDILVIEIMDADLPLSEGSPPGGWPARFEDYARLLRTVGGTNAENRPDGIFFDIFLDREPTAEDPIEALCAVIADLAKAGVPLFFASLEPSRERGLPRSLASCPDEPSTASADWWGGESEMGLFGIGSDAVPVGMTAAPALYYATRQTSAAEKFAKMAKASPLMTVMWGARSPVKDAQCTSFDVDSLRGRLARSGDLFVESMMLDGEARKRAERQQICPYHARVPVKPLLTARGPLAKIYADQFFADRFVLIGANLSGIPDTFSSPVHGQLPGVYLHAMALDNLLVWGERYVRPTPDLPLTAMANWAVSANDLLEFLLLFVLAIAIWVSTTTRLSSEHVGIRVVQALVIRMGMTVFLAVTIFIAVIISHGVLHWAPLNWGGVLVAGLTMVWPWKYRNGRSAL